jgi:SAM-dependent methyltransferase
VVIPLALAAAMSIAAAARPVAWADLPPEVQARLQASGMQAAAFDAKVAALDRDAARRVREGDFDHLVFYVLQSTHFTTLPPIEPALSAKALLAWEVRPKPADTRTALAPPDVEARLHAFLDAVASGDRDPRLAYFRALLDGAQTREQRRVVIETEYQRAMVFLRRKEFEARTPDAAARLYQTRGFSTDTAVEAGYAVQTGLGVLKALDPSRRIRRVLIVGPGMDLAPRTGMLEAGPPESYQPWAVIDALVALGLANADDLVVVGADINPRVVDHLRASAAAPPRLHLVSGIGASGAVTFAAGYREYFESLGRAVGTVHGDGGAPAGHLSKTVAVSARAARTLRAERLNIVTERLTGEPFDLIVATNILPYFDHVERLLALSNIAGMLAPGGVFLHNDPRPEVIQDATAAGLAGEQLRQVIVADVKGAPPLADTIILHRRR